MARRASAAVEAETAEAASTGGEGRVVMWCRGGKRGGRPGGFKGGSRQKSRRPRDPEIEGISGRRAPGEGVRIEGAGDLPGSRGVSASPDT
jgi:hypothetical protein